jgi:arsenate reductase
MAELELPDSVVMQDIKTDPLTPTQLDELKRLSGSYLSLFSKRARLFKERNLRDRELSEAEIKDLILEHYTFLQRPVLVWDEQIFIGNSKKTVELAFNTVNPN